MKKDFNKKDGIKASKTHGKANKGYSNSLVAVGSSSTLKRGGVGSEKSPILVQRHFVDL